MRKYVGIVLVPVIFVLGLSAANAQLPAGQGEATGCSWWASVTGHFPAVGDFKGTTGRITSDDGQEPPLTIDAVIQENDLQPGPPWMVIRLRNFDRSRLTDPGFINEIAFALPGVGTRETGPFNRIWGTFMAGPESYKGNADYLRRDLVGIPGGSGIGHLLTSNVNLTRNDDERIIGSFDARFLNEQLYRELDVLQQHPVGVGVHAISGAEIAMKGEFSILKDGSCSGGIGRPRRK
ncbi:MAG: hypothetical protein WBS20_12045 [Lysobacterales bacterium]